MALNQLLTFTDSGNTYITYYNDVTAGIECTKNGVTITSDPASPISHSAVGSYSLYQFCNIKTLVRFKGIAAFPYTEQENNASSPTCDTVYCDISIETPVTTTAESSPGANDGSLTASATSSNGTPQYSIDNNTFQVSGTFSSLAAGSYTVYARDGTGLNNCLATASVIVPQAANYGTIYNAFYINDLKENVEIQIKKKNYSSAITTLTSGQTPYIKQFGNQNEDKYKAIKGSSARIQLVSETFDQLNELYNAKEYEYQIAIYKSGSLDWIGFLVVEQYEQTYSNPPYIIELEAVDGLASLKNFPFKNKKTEFYTGVKSLQEIYKICLDKLSLNLDIYEGVRIFETNQDTANDDSPLAQTYINASAFITNKKEYKVKSCYQVLEGVLSVFGCRILQSGGVWYIQQLNELISSYRLRKYDYLLTALSNESFDPKISLSLDPINQTNLLTFAGNSAIFRGLKAYKEFTIEHRPIINNQLLEGGDFSSLDWDQLGSNLYWGNFPLLRQQEGAALTLDGGTEQNADYIESVGIEVEAGKFNFTFTYNFQPQSTPETSFTSRAYAQIEIDTGATLYYIDTLGEVVTTANEKIESIVLEYNKDITVSIDFELEAANEGTLRVRIMQGVGNDVLCQKLTLKKVHLFALYSTGEGALIGSKNPDELISYTYENNSEDFSFVPDPIELFIGDGEKAAENTKLINSSALQLSDETLTTLWSRDGVTDNLPILNLLALNIIRNHSESSKLLRASLILRGNKTFDLHNTLELPSLQKQFILNYYSKDDRKGLIEIEAFENLSNEFYTNPFTFKIDTRNTSTGSSTSTQFTIPTISSGTYDFLVDDGAGNRVIIQSWNDLNRTLNYDVGGIYEVKIYGTITGWQFNNAGDKDKILEIIKVGGLIIQDERSFEGCSNLSVTNITEPFTFISDIDIFRNAFSGTAITTFPFLEDLILTGSNEVEFRQVFTNSDFNDTIENIPLKPKNMRFTFAGTPFNQPLANLDTSLNSSFNITFQNAASFNQDVSMLSIASLTDAASMFNNATSWSDANYDLLLDINTGWASQPIIQNNVSFGAQQNKYNASEVDSGTTDGATTAFKLIDSTQNFVTTVSIGDVIYNTTNGTYARVTAIDSDTQLSIDVDIMATGEGYSVQSSNAAKGKAKLVIDFSWVFIDAGYII